MFEALFIDRGTIARYRTGLSRSTIYVRLEQGRFPRPVSLGARAIGWIESEVDEWIRGSRSRRGVGMPRKEATTAS